MGRRDEAALKKALKKRALGYTYEEQVKELKEVRDDKGNSENKLIVTKVVKKEVQPDTAAIKILLDSVKKPEEDIEEILKEKDRIINEYLADIEDDQ